MKRDQIVTISLALTPLVAIFLAIEMTRLRAYSFSLSVAAGGLLLFGGLVAIIGYRQPRSDKKRRDRFMLLGLILALIGWLLMFFILKLR